MNTTPVNGIAGNTNLLDGNDNVSFGIPDLDNIQLDTPPDLQLSVSRQSPSLTLLLEFLSNVLMCYLISIFLQNLQFGSQDSILEWIGRLL